MVQFIVEKKTTLVHRYKNHLSWRGKKYANNITGRSLLTNAIVDAGFTDVRFNDHIKRRPIYLMPREQM